MHKQTMQTRGPTFITMSTIINYDDILKLMTIDVVDINKLMNLKNS